MHSFLDRLLLPEIRDYLTSHEDEDEKALVLRSRDIAGVPAALLAGQIAARRKAKEKLPIYYSVPGIVYPASINMEQCSSETTARLKQSLIAAALTTKISAKGVDMTGGFGIDSFFLSDLTVDFDYVEPDTTLMEISRHNHRLLGRVNIAYHNVNAMDFISRSIERYDFIFMDPSRRKGDLKVVMFSDCEPDPIVFLPKLLSRTDLVVIKASPLLDLQQGIKALGVVEKICVVAVRNECKEVLFFCGKHGHFDPEVRCINITIENQVSEFAFSFSEERKTHSMFSDPLNYLYEPNAAILKGGGFRSVGARFGLSKIHPHTHLYTSNSLVNDFPGRIFLIEQIDPDFRKSFPDGKANIVTRNYPLSTEQLRKKVKLRDGGEKFLIGFTGMKSRFTVSASRIR